MLQHCKHVLFHKIKVILVWKNQNCYFKLFYKATNINLIKSLEKVKIIYIKF